MLLHFMGNFVLVSEASKRAREGQVSRAQAETMSARHYLSLIPAVCAEARSTVDGIAETRTLDASFSTLYLAVRTWPSVQLFP